MFILHNSILTSKVNLLEYEVAEARPEEEDDDHPPQRPRGHRPRALHRHPLREDARRGGHPVTSEVTLVLCDQVTLIFSVTRSLLSLV